MDQRIDVRPGVGGDAKARGGRVAIEHTDGGVLRLLALVGTLDDGRGRPPPRTVSGDAMVASDTRCRRR
jgi:hypothetical protein